MTKEELIEYLKEKLSLDIKCNSAYMGSTPNIEIMLILDKEEIACINFELPNEDDQF